MNGKRSLGLLLSLFVLVSGMSHAWSADPNPASIQSERGAWPLYRQWTPAEVDRFGVWIEHLYDKKLNGPREQQLAKLEGVLSDPDVNLLLIPAFAGSPSNPQLDEATMRNVHEVLDCGKLTIVLGAYYAYRRGLPWMATQVRAVDGSDVRTSPHNLPTGDTSCRAYPSPYAFITDAVRGFNTGNYRVEPHRETSEWSCTAPIAIDPRYLKPGALFYLDGHVLILAKIDPYGGMEFLDATVSPTRDIYTHNRLNAVTGITATQASGDQYSGCYRGFKSFRWPVAETNSAGEVIRVRRMNNKEMAAFGYSTEQFHKLRELMDTGKIRDGKIQVDSFHAFVRHRMRSASQIDPYAILRSYSDRIHALAKEREQLVQAGWQNVQREGAVAFPVGNRNANIFTAEGRWGAYTSSLIDARIRAEYFHLISDLENAVNWYQYEPNYVKLDENLRRSILGRGDLAVMLTMEKERLFHERRFHYTNSAGQPIGLTLRDLEMRLYDLSFDPNHPPELRWGAKPGSQEARTAKKRATPLPGGRQLDMEDAYARQAYYRTATYRDVDESFLADMATEGFPALSKFNEHFAQRWLPERVPPLVPTGWKHYWIHHQRLAHNL